MDTLLETIDAVARARTPRHRRPRPHRRPAAANGFTLIEAVCVLAIAAVVLAMALGASMDWGRGAAMRAAAGNVESDLALAREWAVTRAEPVTIACSNTPGANRGYYLVTRRDSGLVGTTNYLGEGIVWTSGVSSVVFDPEGACADPASTNGPALHLVLVEAARGAGALARTVTVYRQTGYARIEP